STQSMPTATDLSASNSGEQLIVYESNARCQNASQHQSLSRSFNESTIAGNVFWRRLYRSQFWPATVLLFCWHVSNSHAVRASATGQPNASASFSANRRWFGIRASRGHFVDSDDFVRIAPATSQVVNEFRADTQEQKQGGLLCSFNQKSLRNKHNCVDRKFAHTLFKDTPIRLKQLPCNGYECADTELRCPVFFPSLPSDSSANSNAQDAANGYGRKEDNHIRFLTIEQTIWNQVLFKATTPTIKRATQYEFTRVQRKWLTLESRPPTNFTVTPIPIDFTKSLPTLRIDFTDTWDLSPSCQVETRVGKLLLERDYNQLDMPEGFHFTRLVGNVTRLRTCRDLTCGPGSQCVVEGPVGSMSLPCCYVESGAGACRAVCGPNLCDVNAECLINKCICASGYSGDGLVCQADDRDCRLAQAACRPEDGFACMQQATRSGIEYRCQCGSSKCIREADAACRQQAGCSQFANCLPGANGGPSTCVCRQGFKGDGRVCLPELCADNATCSDAGAYAFCNASRLCDTCPPPKSIAPRQPSDCMENAQCDPVSNACVCKPGFAANRLAVCSIACRTVQRVFT
uniref:EGF-like domain-containing protein n=1 Tax=Macrostomum lignano TaxID=282301 RepID=A0A1I8FFY1_9PLAT